MDVRDAKGGLISESEDLEGRIRNLEGWKSEAARDGKRGQQLSAGIGAGAGRVVAVVLKLFGGGSP